jgi:hypothetical protein
MKRHVLAAIATLAVATPLFAQAIPLTVPSATPSPAAARPAETVTGRITRLDAKAGTFAVKVNNSTRVIKLRAGDSVNLKKLRRGQRVTVTYSGGIATQVEATRSVR